MIPLGKANIVKEGKDLTVVTYGIGVDLCKKAMAEIPGASIELIDLRTVVPMDFAAVVGLTPFSAQRRTKVSQNIKSTPFTIINKNRSFILCK